MTPASQRLPGLVRQPACRPFTRIPDGFETRSQGYAGAGAPLDHCEFNLAIFHGSRRKRVARHLFDGRPICEKIPLRLYLYCELGLQNAALPRIAIGYLKGDALRSWQPQDECECPP